MLKGESFGKEFHYRELNNSSIQDLAEMEVWKLKIAMIDGSGNTAMREYDIIVLGLASISGLVAKSPCYIFECKGNKLEHSSVALAYNNFQHKKIYRLINGESSEGYTLYVNDYGYRFKIVSVEEGAKYLSKDILVNNINRSFENRTIILGYNQSIIDKHIDHICQADTQKGKIISSVIDSGMPGSSKQAREVNQKIARDILLEEIGLTEDGDYNIDKFDVGLCAELITPSLDYQLIYAHSLWLNYKYNHLDEITIDKAEIEAIHRILDRWHVKCIAIPVAEVKADSDSLFYTVIRNTPSYVELLKHNYRAPYSKMMEIIRVSWQDFKKSYQKHTEYVDNNVIKCINDTQLEMQDGDIHSKLPIWHAKYALIDNTVKLIVDKQGVLHYITSNQCDRDEKEIKMPEFITAISDDMIIRNAYTTLRLVFDANNISYNKFMNIGKWNCNQWTTEIVYVCHDTDTYCKACNIFKTILSLLKNDCSFTTISFEVKYKEQTNKVTI